MSKQNTENRNNIRAELLTTGINAERLELQQAAADIVSDSRTLFIGIVEKKSGKLFMTDYHTGRNRAGVCDFDRVIGTEIQHVEEDRREAFRKEMNCRYIMEQIRIHGKYTYKINMMFDREEHFLEYYFADYRKYPGTFLVVVEDATDKYSRDELTEVLSIEGFRRFLSQCVYQEEQKIDYVICGFNIKKFKALNYQYGYQRGDRILQKAAAMLKESGLFPKAVCREMADHFYCIVRKEDLSEKELKKLCSMRFMMDDEPVTLTLNCGVYEIDRTEKNINEICDCARMALTESGKESLFPYLIYSRELSKRYVAEVRLLQQIEKAITAKQYLVMYQPVFDIKTQRMVSAEALVRWEHPIEGMIMPGVFIPVLEQSGQIGTLDHYVIRLVKKFLEQRTRKGKRNVPIAVNLSRYDLGRKDLLEDIQKTLSNMRERKCFLRFEITETGLLHISDYGTEFLNKIRKEGCEILIDDFGNGYSSLGSLAEQEFDFVKLDMSFIGKIGRDTRTESVIRAAIAMSHYLGAKVIAEGVEHEEQYRFLMENQCDYVQGYYFSRPLSEAAFEALLEEETPEIVLDDVS